MQILVNHIWNTDNRVPWDTPGELPRLKLRHGGSQEVLGTIVEQVDQQPPADAAEKAETATQPAKNINTTSLVYPASPT